MINHKEIIDRLKEYKNFKTNHQLAEYLEVTDITVSFWYNEKRGIDLLLLFEKFPELSHTWIITGIGDKYIDNLNKQNEKFNNLKDELKKNDTEISEITEDCNSLDSEIRIRQLEAQVNILKDIVFQKMK